MDIHGRFLARLVSFERFLTNESLLLPAVPVSVASDGNRPGSLRRKEQSYVHHKRTVVLQHDLVSIFLSNALVFVQRVEMVRLKMRTAMIAPLPRV